MTANASATITARALLEDATAGKTFYGLLRGRAPASEPIRCTMYNGDGVATEVSQETASIQLSGLSLQGINAEVQPFFKRFGLDAEIVDTQTIQLETKTAENFKKADSLYKALVEMDEMLRGPLSYRHSYLGQEFSVYLGPTKNKDGKDNSPALMQALGRVEAQFARFGIQMQGERGLESSDCGYFQPTEAVTPSESANHANRVRLDRLIKRVNDLEKEFTGRSGVTAAR